MLGLTLLLTRIQFADSSSSGLDIGEIGIRTRYSTTKLEIGQPPFCHLARLRTMEVELTRRKSRLEDGEIGAEPWVRAEIVSVLSPMPKSLLALKTKPLMINSVKASHWLSQECPLIMN